MARGKVKPGRELEAQYEESVYAGVLGKVIGVYLGRPFEGWSKDDIQKKWGMINGYVHEDLGYPLVVSDDDITGTFTFIRALEDSGLYQETPVEFFGDTWLNYLLEKQTILWWSGLGFSTEHTAYLRLKDGIKAPASGSMALNGRTVAEQIGAQIFIDGFGLVTPGNPALAAELARKAASVSHDGEAVLAAMVVAAMVSAAFVEKRMDRLLDIGISMIPAQSLIARIHREVRAWCRKDQDWQRTYDRIKAKYGYQKYGGNCHVVPNHAIMVMAWCYAPDDFYESQRIINSAGWDTDCNAANVGCVMGVKLGLKALNARYDFQSPFADRIILPTAEGTRSTSDCLKEALAISRIGRKVMGWQDVALPKRGAWHHFEMPGARHGYMNEPLPNTTGLAACVENVPGHSRLGSRTLAIRFDVDAGRQARISTPVLAQPVGGTYHVVATSQLYAGMTVSVSGSCGKLGAASSLRLFVRYLKGGKWSERTLHYADPIPLRSGKAFDAVLTVPDTHGCAVLDFGIELSASARSQGELFIDSVRLGGKLQLSYPDLIPRDTDAPGWIKFADHLGGSFSDDPGVFTHLIANTGRGILVTGNTSWRDYTIEANVKIHIADMGGLLFRYQGMERYLALVWTRDQKLRLLQRYYGDTVLAEASCSWGWDKPHHLRVECRGRKITAYCDGRKVLEANEVKLGAGGAGLVFEKGMIGYNGIKITS